MSTLIISCKCLVVTAPTAEIYSTDIVQLQKDGHKYKCKPTKSGSRWSVYVKRTCLLVHSSTQVTVSHLPVRRWTLSASGPCWLTQWTLRSVQSRRRSPVQCDHWTPSTPATACTRTPCKDTINSYMYSQTSSLWSFVQLLYFKQFILHCKHRHRKNRGTGYPHFFWRGPSFASDPTFQE